MSRPRRTLGFSWPVLAGLAALAVPRLVLHDLDVIHEGSLVNGLLVFLPPLCWIAAVLWRRPARPFLTVLVIGVLYGVFLAAGHQLLWDTAFGGATPTLGGNLADVDPAVQRGLMRGAAVVSSLVTGTLVGAVTGAVAALLCRVVTGQPERTDDPGT
ncbi:hypothetical protein Daura_30430 [Dactylosporangium aurantiacum]|uniref:Uncharacterized protein n=1 Tax=Dactylosporangium aurantiacum TaxID=35754 RepID=A0A9Q9IB63_9ACTN|nr:hypothetical protein [Dactylosporangium aurantiacum]MDG6108715.1 hypothetical protein [Dactylosporangium aurantiacum]UWZ51078.1 hypothetical protein Daura_30430 [Dactylosporangium aurantiacum]